MKFPRLLPGLLLVLTGCRMLQPVKDSAVYHVLDSRVPDRILTAATPAVAVNRPWLPTYLDRPEVVDHRGGQLQISRVDLWAEPLGTAIARVTANNLSRLTGSLNIHPVEQFTTLDYTKLLELKITRFEPDVSGQIILQGTWKLQPVTGQETSARFFRIEVPVAATAAPMGGRVAAMNLALERLARQIVSEK